MEPPTPVGGAPLRRCLLIGLSVFLLIVAIGVLGSSARPQPILAAEKFIPEIPLPGVFDQPQAIDNNLLANYIRAVYVYFIWVVGIVAVVMVIYGGIKWVSAAGNPGRINDARDTINGAIIGLIIALVSVVLLNVINPKLTDLDFPGLPGVARQFTGQAVDRFCNSSEKIACGDMKKTGESTVDPTGTTVDEWCLGTRCDGNDVCPVLLEEVPRVSQSTGGSATGSFTYYKPGGDCSHFIKLADNRPADYGSLSSIESARDGNATPTMNCGKIYPDNWYRAGTMVGTMCSGNDDKRGCFITKLPAEIIDLPGNDDDTISNMGCPPE